MTTPRFQNLDAGWPTQFLRARAVVTAAKTTFADLVNAVELQRFDINAAGGPIGGANGGGLIKRVTASARATFAGGRIFLFSSLDNGQNIEQRGFALLAAYDTTQSTAVVLADFGATETVPFRVAPGERWWAATAVALAAGIVVQAEGDGFDV